MAPTAATKTSRGGKRYVYSHVTHRLREIERIINDRHGLVPETDDADVYLLAVAQCLRQLTVNKGKLASAETVTASLSFWCEKWAPHIVPAAAAAIARQTMRGVPRPPKADRAVLDLRLSDADRTRLDIRTIGSYDVNRQARAKRRLVRKRERDRERARTKRAQQRIANGKPTRAQYLAASLSRTEPWKAIGISRRTYERRMKANRLSPLD